MSSRWFSNFPSYLSTMTGRPAPRHRRLARDRMGRYGAVLSLQRHVAAVINTSTTIVTFLMVFLIQNTQNRDTAAMQIKLDELDPRDRRRA